MGLRLHQYPQQHAGFIRVRASNYSVSSETLNSVTQPTWKGMDLRGRRLGAAKALPASPHAPKHMLVVIMHGGEVDDWDNITARHHDS